MLLASAPAHAQQSGEIRGEAVDARGGEPLANVKIQLVATPHGTITDAEGGFQIRGIPAGEYELQASTVGYRLLRKPFSLAAGEVVEFEIILSPVTFRHTDSVEVRADAFEPVRADSPSELTLAGGEAKNLASVLADDPLRAVQGLPGVTSNDDFRSQFSLRGAGYHRVGLYLDGMLLHAPFHMVAGEESTGSLTAFQGDLLEDISLHSGAPPVRYADRTAGILDLRTREGTRLAPSVRFTASASNTGFVAEGPLGQARKGSWVAGVRKSYLQYLLKRVTDDPTLAFGFLDAQARLVYDLSAKHNVSLSIIEGVSALDRAEARNRLGLNSVMLSDLHLSVAGLTWRYEPGAKVLVTNSLTYMRERFENRNPDRSRLGGGYYGEWIWNATANWTQSESASLDAGWSVRRIRDDGFLNWYQFNPYAVFLMNDYRGSTARPGAYLQQSWSTAGGRLRLSGGARWDRHGINEVQTVSPQASLAVRPLEATRIMIAWGQSVQHPEFLWLLSRIGNRRLLPERANHLLAVVEQRLDERTRVRAEFYDREDRDLLFRPLYEPRLAGGFVVNPPAEAPARNSVRGYARGFEIFVQRRTANRLAGWVSYAYGRARLRDGETGARFPSDQDQRHTVNVYASWRIRPTVNLSLKWLYGSGFPVPGFLREEGGRYYLAETRNEARLESYQRADTRINKTFSFDRWRMTLYAELVNVFNRENWRYDSFGGYDPETGRAFPRFDKMFPILPSAGIVLEFEGRQ